MRHRARIALTAGIACSLLALSAPAQDDRNFVFQDEDGHMLLRFVGVEPGGLDAEQTDEVVNVSLSTMVHDRLQADMRFEAEPVDAHWASPTSRRIEAHLHEADTELKAVHVECRSTSCRLILDHGEPASVDAHRSVMDSVQTDVEAMLAAMSRSFEPVYLLAGHSQPPGTPHVKVFLERRETAD